MSDIKTNELVDSGALPPEDFSDSIERIIEVADFDLLFDNDKFSASLSEASGLAISEDIIESIVAAIQVGNIVLQGPPGTGKSSLARAIAKAFNVATTLVTAHDDWSTYDVIGRLELKSSSEGSEQIIPVNGCFTQTVINCANRIVRNFDNPTEPQAEWLVIDELNRAHLDRAFGELFTVLGTDDLVPVSLPHQKEGNKSLVIPRRFRVIATLNSYDKQFVNNLSQAIRRRFTFINIDIPRKKPDEVSWIVDDTASDQALRELYFIVRKVSEKEARRKTSLDKEKYDEKFNEVYSFLSVGEFGLVKDLMSFIESIRYSEAQEIPYLPIGTAQIIDTLELFVVRVMQSPDGGGPGFAKFAMDWAVSVKLVPLFEADSIDQEILMGFVDKIRSPFDVVTRRELEVVVNSGMSFVPYGD